MDPLAHKIQLELDNLTNSANNQKNANFLLAVSGGMDSMVLAHAFLELNQKFGLVHFNFKLRGKASDLDEDLVRRFCDKNHIPFYTRSEDTVTWAKERKLSTQEAARELRYTFFDEVAEEHSFDYVCTAHHGNDQLETFFINLFRGSGLKGLTGMPQIRDRILRPMLWIPHEEIQRFARDFEVEYRDDESNQSDKYLRNQIRHQLIEPLTDSHPAYLSKALDTINLLVEYQNYIQSQLKLFRKHNVWQSNPDIQKITLYSEHLSDPGGLFLIKLYLLDQGIYPDSVQAFSDASGKWQTGSKYEGLNVNAWYDRDELWLIRDSFYNDWNAEDRVELKTGKEIDLPGGDRIYFPKRRSRFENAGDWLIPVVLDQVELPLILRHRMPGDGIELGRPPYSRRSLKKLFRNHAIPLPFKDRFYVLTDAQNRIISIPGMINSPAFTDEENPDILIGYYSHLELEPRQYYM